MKRKYRVNIYLLLQAAAVTLAPVGVYGHGSMEIPVSRVYNCYQEGPENPQSEACRAAVKEGGTQALYDWNGVNRLPNGRHRELIPDGQLCSAGKPSHKGLDLARDDWPATTIVPDLSGNFEFVYRATAPHSTLYFEFYITKDGYDPTQPLGWDDLEDTPFCTVTEVTLENGRYFMTCPLPRGKTGRHMIYNVWQRDDSPEAFYACIDVLFGEEPDEDPPTVHWRELGRLRAQHDHPVGTKVTFRLFDSSFRDIELHTVALLEGENTVDAWPFHLAQRVNAESSLVQIGVLEPSGSIIPVESSMGNSVYVKSHEGFSFQIDFELPDNDDDTPGPDSDVPDEDLVEWKSGATYVAGDRVVHQGLTYEAKWWTRGDEPIPNPTVPWETPWDLLDEDPSGPGDNTWNSSKIYVQGDRVTHAGNEYVAKWWTQNFPPDTPVNHPWETPWELLP